MMNDLAAVILVECKVLRLFPDKKKNRAKNEIQAYHRGPAECNDFPGRECNLQNELVSETIVLLSRSCKLLLVR